VSENSKIWDILGRTDPAHTKAFTRGGGFKGTAIKPIWSYKRMTEEFGPCGIGWGVGEPQFQVVPANDEILVYCTASVWFRQGDETSKTIYGVGGDKVVSKFSSGLRSDDEAFKKAFTDAVTNALKLIGVGADVHMGLFDDNKYVNTMREEFSETLEHRPQDQPSSSPHEIWGREPTEGPAKSSAQLKREDAWTEFDRELDECKTLVMLEKFKEAWREKAKQDGWNKAFKEAARDRIEGRHNAILNEMEAAELASVPVKEALTRSVAITRNGQAQSAGFSPNQTILSGG